jgi:casein kinase II subunit beta
MTITRTSSIGEVKMKHSFISDTDDDNNSEKSNHSWIDSFLEQPESNWFCRIPTSYINDTFNTYGLCLDAPHRKSAFSQLLGNADNSSDSFDSDSEDEIEKATEQLYGLIHARYIFTAEGVAEMTKKFNEGVFGKCPRYECHESHLIPIGLTDRPNVETVKSYCFCCKQVYEVDPAYSTLDGAYFTKSFPHYFLMELKSAEKAGRMTNEPSVMTSESQPTNKITKDGFQGR